jgi:hypothetical protein
MIEITITNIYSTGHCPISADKEFYIEIGMVANLKINNLEIVKKTTIHSIAKIRHGKTCKFLLPKIFLLFFGEKSPKS